MGRPRCILGMVGGDPPRPGMPCSIIRSRFYFNGMRRTYERVLVETFRIGMEWFYGCIVWEYRTD